MNEKYAKVLLILYSKCGIRYKKYSPGGEMAKVVDKGEDCNAKKK